jgi:catechol 2,3-dioxygenase-like lactoylglutathione lyase family enzyme
LPSGPIAAIEQLEEPGQAPAVAETLDKRVTLLNPHVYWHGGREGQDRPAHDAQIVGSVRARPELAKGPHMLGNTSVTTMLPVIDMARARVFYEQSLGLMPGNFKPDGKFEYAVGGSTLALFPKPDGTKAEHTAVSFRVSDVVAAIARLQEAGVVFEDYDLPGFKTIDHVCVLGSEKAAWFKDTEGNYLCIHEDLD